MDSEAEHDDAPIAVVLVTRRQGREYVDAEHKVRTLQELYDLCRHAAPGPGTGEAWGARRARTARVRSMPASL